MQLQELFRPENIVLSFDPADKWEAIRELMQHLDQTQAVPDELLAELLDKVLARERSMSTGMEHGIALPHAAVDGLESVVAALGVVDREGGLVFESIDGQPTQLVVLLLIPKAQKLLHIRTLADVARVLGKESVRQALLTAQTGDEAHHAIAEGEGSL